MGAQCAAHKAAHGRQQADPDVHGSLLEELHRGKGGAAGRAEFIGAVGVMHRQARKQADQAAAARRRVHKARKSGHQHQKQQHWQ